MNSTELVTYIRDAGIFNIAAIEKLCELPTGALRLAVAGIRPLPEKYAVKILAAFRLIGVCK